MKTALFLAMVIASLIYLIAYLLRLPPVRRSRCIDVIVPAFNEEPCLESALHNLLSNPYVARVICVNDGSTDGTGALLDRLTMQFPRLQAVHQANTGKGGAVMHGLQHVTAPFVLLTDADTHFPPDRDGLGYLLADMMRGADAVGGIPSSNLRAGGLLPSIRATVKYPMIVAKRTFQQMLGGAPFLISGACGLFRTEVLRKVGLSDRTKVEDLDLTWTLIRQGYKVRQNAFCTVYPQECHTFREEWRRWRRWIMGYAVCMRLHRGLLLTRYGLFSILPMFLVAALGMIFTAMTWGRGLLEHGPTHLGALIFPLTWMVFVAMLGLISAVHHRRPSLVLLSPLSIVYVLLAYSIWLAHGFAALFTGREFGRDKPTRQADVVA